MLIFNVYQFSFKINYNLDVNCFYKRSSDLNIKSVKFYLTLAKNFKKADNLILY